MAGRELGQQMVTAVKGYVALMLAPVLAGLTELRAKLEALPVPKDGTPGKDATPIDETALVERLEVKLAAAVAALPRPKNGEDGDDGLPGTHGRDALEITVLDEIDEAKAYPRGTFACYKGGIIRAARKTDPIIDDLEKAGWQVCMNGIFAQSEEVLDEGRTVRRKTAFTSGKEVVTEIKTASILYRDIYREGNEYQKGDAVTYGGSLFHCQEDKTTDKPETSAAWKLAVKRGRDGKDAKK